MYDASQVQVVQIQNSWVAVSSDKVNGKCHRRANMIISDSLAAKIYIFK